jgi:hypothetical protein
MLALYVDYLSCVKFAAVLLYSVFVIAYETNIV